MSNTVTELGTIDEHHSYIYQGHEVKWTGRTAIQAPRNGFNRSQIVLYEMKNILVGSTAWVHPHEVFVVQPACSSVDILLEGE